MNTTFSVRSRVVATIITLVMVLTLMPAIQTKTKADVKPPQNLTFELGSYGATIGWGEVSESTSFSVYKAPSRFAEYSLVTTTPGLSYTDTNYNSGEYYKVTATVGETESEMSEPTSYEIATFGADTYIFDDTDNMAEVNDLIYNKYKNETEKGQFGSGRYAFMFKSSSTPYDVTVDIGFYTQVAGLGLTPDDTNVKQIQSKAEWMKGRKYDGTINYNALCNFWRAIENLSTNATDTIWAVSQATSMRRMNFKGGVKKWKGNDTEISFNDFATLYLHQDGGYASGGFLADSKIASQVSSGSQQQWLSRNVKSGNEDPELIKYNYRGYTPAVWNNVLAGCVIDNGNSYQESNWPRGTTTVMSDTEPIAEKPFLYYDEGAGKYYVVRPKMRKSTRGVSWDDSEMSDYDFIPMEDCFIAKPADSAATINAAMQTKQALILTPGIYEVDEPIVINRDSQTVLGLGYATIKPTTGNECMKVGNVCDTRIAGVLFDAGRIESNHLLVVGDENADNSNPEKPSILSDCFFRVGGADSTPCKTKTCVVINNDDVICDNFWVWRADHGAGVGWYKNKADHGVIFNGDRITAYGLMVEHFQKEQTIWNGNDGKCYMYQSELPYDIPNQKEWSPDGSYGYTDYHVDQSVEKHEGHGIGIYSCYQAAQSYLKSAIVCPDKEGVKFEDVITHSLVGNGSIDHPINDINYGIYATSDQARVVSYCNGKYTLDRADGRKAIWQAYYDTEFPNKVYTGKPVSYNIPLTLGGVKLRNGIDYKITYKNNKKIGTASLTITGIGNFKEYDSYNFKIVPGKTKITKASGTKKKIKIKYKKVLGAGGYQICYAKKSNFKGKKTIKTKKTSYKIKRKSKKAYYVKVRAYKKVGKKYYYGSYCKKKKVKKVK